MSKNRKKHGKFLKNIIKIIICLIFILVFNFFLNKNIFITHFTEKSTRLPESFENYKITQLTDIHSVRSEKQKNKIIEKVSMEKPNVIFITGDLIDSNYYKKQEELLESGKIENVELLTIDFMKELAKIAPVYYVYGNHESCLFNYKDTSFVDSLEEIGIHIINNVSGYLYYKDSYIKLIGLEDPYVFAYDTNFKKIRGNNQDKVKAILDELYKESDDNKYTILLSHRPELFETYCEYNVDLIFSGHAHGGIVRLPFVGGLYSNPQGIFPKYSAGEYFDNFHTMILGRGIGRSREPIRIFNPPEIVSVVLNRK